MARPLRRSLTRGTWLVLGAATVYLLAPAVLEVFSSWDQVSRLELRWFLGVGLAQGGAIGLTIALQRLLLRTKAWVPVATAQLAANAAGRVVPGGAAAAAAVQFRLLTDAGVRTTHASVGLAAAGVLQFGTILALPIVAIPGALFGVPIPTELLAAAILAASLFGGLLLVVFAIFTSDHALRWAGTAVDWVGRRLPALAGSGPGAPERMVEERDHLRDELGSCVPAALALATGRSLFDYASLALALAAFGADARPALLLVAFATAALLAMIPLTPGGLGFVETGLTGTLALIGVSPTQAVSVALLYRLFSFWLPIPIGLAAGVFHRSRYRPQP